MRYAVLSDVHANLAALDAVLAALEGEAVDHHLCTGDLVGYGPRPDECIARLRQLGATCVAGNHDLLALGELAPTRSGPMARATLDWTRAALSDASRDYLAALPRTRRVDGLLLAHGSPTDPEEYVTAPARADQLLDALDPACTALLLGHTHHPWAHARRSGTALRRGEGRVELAGEDRYLLNPGSVGQSRDRTLLARFLVLDTGAGTATFHAVDYDVAALRADLARAGLPPTYQLRPRRSEGARRMASRVARGVRRTARSARPGGS